MKKIAPLLVFGTRPEAIKMAPLVLECARRVDDFQPMVCVTGQHREMLDAVLGYFDIRPDVDLAVMTPNQTLASLTGRCLEGLYDLIARERPDCVVVQGDTTTAMAAGLAAFYHHVPLVHVEAGLRTGDLQAPWPEEFNRRLVSLAATLHCAPTRRSAAALLAEGIAPNRIHVTGNTVVDALLWTAERERREGGQWAAKYAFLRDDPLVLVTGHRRENFGEGLANLCNALSELAARYPNVQFLYPMHLNPRVQIPVREALSNRVNIHLTAPAAYPEFVWLMDRSRVILSDSGGIQEEAPSLGKRVLVMRQTTERPEALETGLVELVGTDAPRIVEQVGCVLDAGASAPPERVVNPFGDGKAAERIAQLIAERAWLA